MRVHVKKVRTGLGFTYDAERDGVSTSLLSKWKACREKARLHLQRWTPKRVGVSRVFGIIIHGVLEHVYQDIQSSRLTDIPSARDVRKHLATVEAQWKKDNPRADKETKEHLELSLLLAECILPIYFRTWARDLRAMKWIALEDKFKVPFKANGISTMLKGRMDGRFHSELVKTKVKRPWLFETKTKSRLGEQGESNLVDILGYEDQACFYLTVLEILEGMTPAGMVYNIIRRPNLQLKKGETHGQFAERLVKDIEKRPDFYFIRLRVTVVASDLERAKTELADTIQDFVRWTQGKAPHYRNSDHCENKYGTCEFLAICARNDYGPFYQRPEIVQELEEV